MTPLFHRSTWLSSIAYHKGYLTLFLSDGTALLYSGVPSTHPGLIAAHKSPGRAYNLLVKGRYPYQKLNRKQAQELRRLVR